MSIPFYLLLLCHAAALAAFWRLPGWAARRDARVFVADGSKDSKHFTFHRQRLLERAGIAMGVAGVASLPMVKTPWLFVLSMAGLLCFAAGTWAYRFNPLLNVARNLPYVGKYYVSGDSRAAFFPDRFIWQRAVRAYPAGGPWNDAERHQNRVAYAAAELRKLLLGGLWAGIVLYAAALVALFLL